MTAQAAPRPGARTGRATLASFLMQTVLHPLRIWFSTVRMLGALAVLTCPPLLNAGEVEKAVPAASTSSSPGEADFQAARKLGSDKSDPKLFEKRAFHLKRAAEAGHAVACHMVTRPSGSSRAA